MTVCPIAIVAGCRKCPAFSVCPLKTVLGDQPKADAAPATGTGKPAAKQKPRSPVTAARRGIPPARGSPSA